MRLSPARFNRFLSGDVHQDFAWRRSYACPCINTTSGSSSPREDCQLCNGKGRQWNAEVSCKAGMTNQTPQKGFAQFGTWESGDATFTIPSSSAMYACGQYDRIRALNSTNPFSYNLVRGDGDKLLGTIVSISRVFWIAQDEVTIVEGGIPTVGADGALTWTTGEPPANVAYSVSGVKYDEFFVYLPLSSDRNSGVSGLPMKLLARVFDLYGR
jgi:hypothetical protein